MNETTAITTVILGIIAGIVILVLGLTAILGSNKTERETAAIEAGLVQQQRVGDAGWLWVKP